MSLDTRLPNAPAREAISYSCLIAAFAQHFSPLVMEGFPYDLAWCWFGITLIVSLVLGAVRGLMIKAPATA